MGQGRPDIASLLDRINAGDENAWTELFATCHPKLMRVVSKRLSTTPSMRAVFDTNDFANDVWKSLYHNWNRYRFANMDALMAFMKSEAVCKIVDEYRRQYAQKRDVSRQKHLDSLAEEGGRPVELASTDPTPSKIVIADELHEQLMENQTPVEKLAIEMSQTGHSRAEIAERTGWHVRKVQRFFQNLSQQVRGHKGEAKA
jgi:DNA-directed RNA polymerase specialized sigma24 family protein